MSRSNFITVLLLLFIVAIAAWAAWRTQQSQLAETASEASRVLTNSEVAAYTDIQGNPIDLEDFSGQVRVVNSWASWCPFCVAELSDFQTLAVEFKEEDVVVIAINRAETVSKINAFLDSLPALDEVLIVLDERDAFYDLIGGFAMPETLFYDRFGNVVVHKRGFM